MTDSLIGRRDYDTAELVRSYPPRFAHPNKKLVSQRACPPGAIHSGKISVTRWRALSLPAPLDAAEPALEVREDVFGYEPEPAPDVAWYLNFADERLFNAYAGPLLAQDELQVLEHPALGSLRDALGVSGLAALTTENNQPTPILISGVERRCALNTTGIYGRAFSRADARTIEAATRVLTPPTTSNILAIEAPVGGQGTYKRSEIERVLVTAYTGFRAARLESERLTADPTVVLHTGFWGCGAYGGNRVLMGALQLLAARLARIDRVVFHTFDRAGASALGESKKLLEPIAVNGARVVDVVTAIDRLELEWGVSDGN